MSDIKDFKPNIRHVASATWEASIRLPVVGDVAVTANNWQEAKLKLWLVAQAVEHYRAQPTKDPKDWTPDEWRRALQTMATVTQKGGRE